MKSFLIATTALLGGTLAAQAEGQLNLFNWGNYTSPEMIEKFTAETGITVTVTDYDSNTTALAKVEAGGSGFDLVVPSANYVPIFVEKGLLAELDHSRLSNIGNVAPEWVNVPWDEGRTHTVPWLWGTTAVAVNTADYSGDINTSDIFLDPPAELIGKVNVVPEMSDVMALAIFNVGGEACTEDLDVLRKVRDKLMAAKPSWLSMDYGTTDKLSSGDYAASVNWNGSTMRARLNNPTVAYGYPVEGYPLWMDSVGLLADAKNVDEAYKFLDFVMIPENAAMISSFARYANGIAGSAPFMPEEMKTAPEIVVPAEFVSAGKFLPTCPQSATELYTAIWTELVK
ncbi:extracellular solute-binding protein [Falsihalocynthiibacter arcticus]|uniref:Putrescine-binding periplasmic protein n=1 Tax=Falsihalocynthiibacter arcticus TaxID=1579316 RepID=A0A126V1A1_9RHOB|nr:extracellular solute-binding protein [Falsihalocynthiibacter arcticus]AML52073.1 putrescine/spermidine ABC transporter substrate-binding protein [Falsihalocynthiibacter arcticus]